MLVIIQTMDPDPDTHFWDNTCCISIGAVYNWIWKWLIFHSLVDLLARKSNMFQTTNIYRYSQKWMATDNFLVFTFTFSIQLTLWTIHQYSCLFICFILHASFFVWIDSTHISFILNHHEDPEVPKRYQICRILSLRDSVSVIFNSI